MEDSFPVHTLGSLEDLLHDGFCLLFNESLFVFENSQEMPFCGVLKKHVKGGLVVEETVETGYVGMVQIELDLQLSGKLVVHFFLDDSLLLNHF